MITKITRTLRRYVGKLVPIIIDLPWLEILTEAWKTLRKFSHRLTTEGMYEVLDYESKLELLDKKGTRAKFTKREKVRYLQNNIIAYQDHAWGDGKILIDYKCTPGKVVDRYRPGHRTFLLISLRESKQRDDEDEFNMEWGIRDGFLRPKELWETEIRHKTRQMKVLLLFPKTRPPCRFWLEQALGKKRDPLGDEAIHQLPDGRWQVTWQKKKPRLNERYQLHWSW